MAHIMLDLETLGLNPGCVIRSIGAVVFEPATGDLGETFYANITRDSCEAYGLTVDADTEAWWAKQDPEIRAALDVDAVGLATALADFADWYAQQQGDRLWCQGPSFDAVVLAAAYRALGGEPPWAYNAPRDTRTIYDLAGIEPDRARASLHNALEDAKAQALDVCRGYRAALERAASEPGPAGTPISGLTGGLGGPLRPLRPLMPPLPAEVPQPLADAWIALIHYCQSIGLHDSTATLVPHFATSLADKLRGAELKHGFADEWKTLDWEADCRAQLLHHVAKGDPLDVAAFAAFCWARKWRTGQATSHLPAKILDLPLDRLREEVWAWRQDAAARLRGMMASAKASDERGEEDRAIDIRVNFLSPSAAALTSYIAGDFHEGCEACCKPLLHGQQVWPVEDANDVHVSCWPGPLVQDGVEIQSYTYSDFDTPESVAAIAAEALAYCHGATGLDDDAEEAAEATQEGAQP